MSKNKKRWKVLIDYKDGQVLSYEIEEVEELQDIVEGGPDFRLLKAIHFEYQYS